MRTLILLLATAALVAGEAKHPPQGQGMPFGPVVHYFVELSAPQKQTVTRAVAVQLSGDCGALFDSETLRYAAWWSGGFVDMTGTIDPEGHIGPVGTIPDKVRAAAREGFRTILIPGGQYYDPHWNLDHLGVELGVTIREVGTIEEAYHLMTGRRLSQTDLSAGA